MGAHDAGFADGHYYFAMELVDGEAMFDLETAGRRIGVPVMMQPIHTLGLVAGKTKAGYRAIRIRRMAR